MAGSCVKECLGKCRVGVGREGREGVMLHRRSSVSSSFCSEYLF